MGSATEFDEAKAAIVELLRSRMPESTVQSQAAGLLLPFISDSAAHGSEARRLASTYLSRAIYHYNLDNRPDLALALTDDCYDLTKQVLSETDQEQDSDTYFYYLYDFCNLLVVMNRRLELIAVARELLNSPLYSQSDLFSIVRLVVDPQDLTKAFRDLVNQADG